MESGSEPRNRAQCTNRAVLGKYGTEPEGCHSLTELRASDDAAAVSLRFVGPLRSFTVRLLCWQKGIRNKWYIFVEGH